MIKLNRLCQNNIFSIANSKQKQVYAKGVPNFQYLSTNYSDDLKAYVHELIHSKSGAKIYQIENQDPQNTFASIFKTFPSDSKGCPHILQHLACCGSQKYPIRDPFFNMIKRSVNSYMNAWTGQDFTCYPFASTNPKDWNNLLSVYSDMSLNPLLNELDFLQQGWRYQLNQKGQKQIKGIVFNQMKGAFQNPQRQLMNAINQSLFAETGYRFDSGGNPKQIVNLSYQQLKKMHQYFYHPSNMSIYFYGNQEISQKLNFLHQQYLSKYQNKANQYQHGVNIKPKQITQHFKTIVSPTAQCNSVALTFYLSNLQQINTVQLLCLKVISYLVLQKNQSFAYQHFIQTGIAENIGPSGFNQSKMSTFGICLKGVQSQYSEKVFYQKVMEIFQGICKNGIPQKRLKQYLHQLQLGIQTPRQNNGIKLLGQIITVMNHRSKLIDYLTPVKNIEPAKQILLNKEKLKVLIQKYFLKNKHFVSIKQLVKEQEEGKQSQQLQDKIRSNIEISQEKILKQQKQLQQRQKSKQDVNVLPGLNLSDLIKKKRPIPKLIEQTNVNKRNIKYHHVTIPNDIHFYRIIFNFKNLPSEINKKLELWNSLINKGISTKMHSYKELSSVLSNYTSGIKLETVQGNNADINLVFTVSCLKRNKQKMLQLLEQILFESVYEKEHIQNLYRLFANDVIQALTDSPIRQCLDEGGATLSLSAMRFNLYAKMKQGLKIVKSQQIKEIQSLNKLLIKCPNIYLIEHSNEIPSKLPKLFERFQSQTVQQFKSQLFVPSMISKAITHNFDVNFCSQQYKGPQFLTKQAAHIQIITSFLEQQYLHPEIREKGGAYGARATIRQNDNISLYSYMDPESDKTFDIFDKSVKKLKNLDKIDPRILNQIKITQVGDYQRIKIPQDQCLGMILRNYSWQKFDNFVQEIKSSKSQQILETTRKYLTDQRSRCIFGKNVPQGFTQQKLSDFIG